MNLNRYEIFLKVAEIRNITKTAEVLHYTQAGISHAMAALEKEVGVPLLIRSSNGVALTENGKRLLEPIRALVNDQHNLAQAIYEVNRMVAGVLRVGTFTSVSTRWLPFMIKAFQEKYPQVEFELFAGDYGDIADCIATGRIDCGFLTEPAGERLHFIPLYRDPILALFPAGHPLASRESVPLSELKKEPFVLLNRGSDNDALTVLKDEINTVRVPYRLDDDFSVLGMVAGGLGVTIMPELLLKNFNFALEMRPIEPPQYRTIGIASLPEKRTSVLTKTFLRFVSSFLEESNDRE